MSVLLAYSDNEPVQVELPDGSTRIVIGFLVRENGISWMDDHFLEELPTRHADHHLFGQPSFPGDDIVLDKHRFTAVTDLDTAVVWERMMVGRDVPMLRKQAEQRLRELRAQ